MSCESVQGASFILTTSSYSTRVRSQISGRIRLCKSRIENWDTSFSTRRWNDHTLMDGLDNLASNQHWWITAGNCLEESTLKNFTCLFNYHYKILWCSQRMEPLSRSNHSGPDDTSTLKRCRRLASKLLPAEETRCTMVLTISLMKDRTMPHRSTW